jgi:hypothetical protein
VSRTFLLTSGVRDRETANQGVVVKRTCISVVASVTVLLAASNVGAQTARATIAETPVRVEPKISAAIVATVKEGAPIDVVDRQGDWYRVLVPTVAGKPRIGYVAVSLVEVVGEDGSLPVAAATGQGEQRQAATQRIPPTLSQISARRDGDRMERTPPATATSTISHPDEQRISRPEPSAARAPEMLYSQPPPDRAWVDVGFARMRSGRQTQTFTLTQTISREVAAAAAAYTGIPAYSDLDLGGGIGLHGGLGLGVHVDGATYEGPVGLAVSIPSPYFFNLNALDARPTSSTVRRQERAVDIGAAYTMSFSDRVSVRAFGGPTYFHVTNEMVNAVHYNQVASAFIPVNVVAITSFTTQEVPASTLGFHVGADVAMFFARRVGVGGGVRFNKGTAGVTDPLSGEHADLQVGHFEFTGGLRLRF